MRDAEKALQPRDRARNALLMGAVTAAGTAIPLGRLPVGRTATVSAGIGAAVMGAGLLVARARDTAPATTSTEKTTETAAESVPEGVSSGPRPTRTRQLSAVATGMMIAGAVVSVGMTTSVLADRWIEKGVRALGSQRPRPWMMAGAGVIGAVLEWFDQPASSSDSPEAGTGA